MKFGISLNNRGPMATPENLLAVTRRAEERGFHSVTVSDHIVIPKKIPSNYPYHPEGRFDWRDARNYFEPLATLMFLAGATQRIRLGTSVLVVSYRNPIIVAKMCSSIDALSGGRIFLGVGTGWWADEYAALGIPSHYAERGPRTDEYIRIFRNLWTEEEPRFEGRFYRYSDIEFSPKPVQEGGIPILVGGHTRRALRRTAELGDGWHPIGLRPPAELTPEQLAAARRDLAALCEPMGRDAGSIPTVFRCPVRFTREREGLMTGGAEAILADVEAYREAGADELIVDLPAPDVATTLEWVDRLAEEVVGRVG